MKRIDQQTIQRIIDSADIVEVVGDFVELKRRGANYIGLCPFHNDRSPSFSVNRARGICKCFSCGEGGNAVNFVMKIRQCNYGEALRYIAAKYNIEIQEAELTEEEIRRRQERDALYAAISAAGEYFNAMRETPEGRTAINQLTGARAIPSTVYDRLDIGYAPRWNTAMLEALATRGFTPEALCAAGLAGVPADENGNSSGPAFDIYNGVITVGIRNRYGRLTGYVAYNTDGSLSPIQMPETAIFTRRNSISGIWQARGAIGRSGEALILSDPLQLLWAAHAGIDNAIALLVGEFTEEHVRTISKLTSDVTVLLPAGSRAIFETLRSTLPMLEAEINVKVVSLPSPHTSLVSFVDANTSDAVTSYLKNQAKDMVLFRIEALRRAIKSSAKNAYRTLFDDIIITVRAVRSPLLRDAYINELSDATGQNTSNLVRLL